MSFIGNARRFERFELERKATWDFFTDRSGPKSGDVVDLSKSGCLLRTTAEISHRRWLRIVLKDHPKGIFFNLIGRVMRREDRLEQNRSGDLSLHRYGIEFTHPSELTVYDLDLILALSNRNLNVRSCLILNTKSSLREGFLA